MSGRFPARATGYALKRAIDIVGASVGLLLCIPIFLLVGIALKQEGGSVFFAHHRVGRRGRVFPCYKLRTMLPDAQSRLDAYLASHPEAREEWARDFKLRDDPRVTKLGQFLRRSSLDELPQLWNVLIGDMSLVGPRPVVEAELERYGQHVQAYLAMRPGITGLWQVSGRNDTGYEQRVALDAQYVREWSVWLDCVILVRTVEVVLMRRGAY